MYWVFVPEYTPFKKYIYRYGHNIYMTYKILAVQNNSYGYNILPIVTLKTVRVSMFQ